MTITSGFEKYLLLHTITSLVYNFWTMKLYNRQIWEDNLPKDLWKNRCPFCKENLEKEYIIHENQYWLIIYNKFPYLWVKKHIMLIPRKHIRFSYEISPDMYSSLWEMYNFISEYYWNEEYFSLTRESFWGRSIEHLHTHFIPWKIHGSDVEGILKKQGFTNQLASD